MAHYGESFFTSLGFAPLPDTFWERSQFVHPRDRDVVCHASAWDVDNVDDLRIKMCIEVERRLLHHRAPRARPQLLPARLQQAAVPLPQRRQRRLPRGHRRLDRALHHARVPEDSSASSTTEPPVEADIPLQLRTALDKVAFLPFGLLIDKWRWQVFSGEIKPADYNKAWWALREKYQGVAPPVERSEADFDPGAKISHPGQCSLCALLPRPHLPVPVL